MSRSATLVIAYVMFKNNFTLEEAFNFVKDKHPRTKPSYGFIQELKKFEAKIVNPN